MCLYVFLQVAIQVIQRFVGILLKMVLAPYALSGLVDQMCIRDSPYNARVTDVQPDGRVTIQIDVPRYLNPYTGLEATGWSAGLGTVPYQRCGATWVIQTAPRNITVNVTLDKSNGNPAMTQGNAACYAQDLSGAVYGAVSYTHLLH